jgi:uncharacterized protein
MMPPPLTNERADVPCGTCHLCCKGQSVPIMPEAGDDPESYRCHSRTLPNGFTYFEIDHHENGDCVYLGADGCTIHERAPYLCRTFDCRRAYLATPRHQRRKLAAEGRASAAVYEAGRARLKSLGT